MENIAFMLGVKKSAMYEWYPDRGKPKEKGKGHGSLSNLVVLHDLWGINPMKPRLGKGVAYIRDSDSETFIESKSRKKCQRKCR